MRFATVTPPKLLEPLGPSLGDYHLILAQLVLEDAEYARFWHNKTLAGHYVILDNGIAEGRRLTNDELRQAHDLVKPPEIVAPDILNDAETTLELAKLFLAEEWVRETQAKVMLVPQGRNWVEWQTCLAELLLLDPDVIGISKFDAHYVPLYASLGRLTAVNAVKAASSGAPEVHLLGLPTSPYELKLISVWSPEGLDVRGADSWLPIAAAARHIKFQSAVGLLTRPDDWHFDAELELDGPQLENARHNIAWCAAAGGGW